MGDIATKLSEVYVRHHKGLAALALLTFPPYEHEDVRGIWLWGDPGIGKSHCVRATFDSVYDLLQTKWFDGYKGESTILIDDFDETGMWLMHHLKLWCDKYPVKGETKGGWVNLQHKRLVITSNYGLEELICDHNNSPVDSKKINEKKRGHFTPIHCTPFA